LLSSAIAVFEHVKDELAVIPCLLLATLEHVRQGVDPFSPWGATGVAALCYGYATSLIWMQQSLGVTTICGPKQHYPFICNECAQT